MSTESTITQTSSQDVDLTSHELALVQWEELALSLEEHYHAYELWQKRPNGPPMGHR
jgi:hypothetical protein